MLIFSGGLLWGSLLMGCWCFIGGLSEDNWEFLRLIESLMRLVGYSTWHLNYARLLGKKYLPNVLYIESEKIAGAFECF